MPALFGWLPVQVGRQPPPAALLVLHRRDGRDVTESAAEGAVSVVHRVERDMGSECARLAL